MHRREFIGRAASAAAAGAFPAIVGASNKSGTKNPIFKFGSRSYECIHDFYELPSTQRWETSHGICLDEAGNAYLIMQGHSGQPTRETIHVFDAAGRYVRSFGKEYHPGGHGIDVRREGNEEFLYICDIHHNQVCKTNLMGERVWVLDLPKDSRVYPENKGYKPTNVAFAPDGGFYIGDGYGSSYIHQYTQDARWIRTFGGPGSDLGKLKTPHGLWFDPRPGRQGLLAVADRGNNRLVYYSPTGETIGTVPGVDGPCNVDFHGELCVVPELFGRVTLLGKDNQVVYRFADDPAWMAEMRKTKVRLDAKAWPAGKFIHPHDATFDKQGNIFIVEWVHTGRVTKLKLL